MIIATTIPPHSHYNPHPHPHPPILAPIPAPIPMPIPGHFATRCTMLHCPLPIFFLRTPPLHSAPPVKDTWFPYFRIPWISGWLHRHLSAAKCTSFTRPLFSAFRLPFDKGSRFLRALPSLLISLPQILLP